MKIKIKSPKNEPVISEYVVEAYAKALSKYACNGKVDTCGKDTHTCFCSFINSLWDFGSDVMPRQTFYKFTTLTDMTDDQHEELYRNYVHNWCSEQTLEERFAVSEMIRKAKRGTAYKLCVKAQELAKDVEKAATEILARV